MVHDHCLDFLVTLVVGPDCHGRNSVSYLVGGYPDVEVTFVTGKFGEDLHALPDVLHLFARSCQEDVVLLEVWLFFKKLGPHSLGEMSKYEKLLAC